MTLHAAADFFAPQGLATINRMNFRSVCALLVVGVALASGLSGLCEMVCAVAGVEHHRMSHGAASGHDHVGAPPATSAAAHAHHESDASSSASKCPHCPAGVDCMISPSALPLDAALTMGELPTSGLPAMY